MNKKNLIIFVFIITIFIGGIIYKMGLFNKKNLNVSENKGISTQYDRRNKNNFFIKKQGIECYENLPLVESSSEVKMKSLDEICNRAFTCFISIQVACDVNNNNYEESIKYFKPILEELNLEQYLNSKEKRIFDGTYTVQDAIDLDWEYEDLWSLFFALGLVDDITDGGKLCDCDFIIKTMASCKNVEEFKKKCKLRDIEEILDMIDLYYRYDWACTEKRIRPETNIGDLNPSNVVERRRGLEWLISSEDDWYEISLDT